MGEGGAGEAGGGEEGLGDRLLLPLAPPRPHRRRGAVLRGAELGAGGEEGGVGREVVGIKVKFHQVLAGQPLMQIGGSQGIFVPTKLQVGGGAKP